MGVLSLFSLSATAMQVQATWREGHLKPHLSRKLGFEWGQGARGHS